MTSDAVDAYISALCGPLLDMDQAAFNERFMYKLVLEVYLFNIYRWFVDPDLVMLRAAENFLFKCLTDLDVD